MLTMATCRIKSGKLQKVCLCAGDPKGLPGAHCSVLSKSYQEAEGLQWEAAESVLEQEIRCGESFFVIVFLYLSGGQPMEDGSSVFSKSPQSHPELC